MKKTFITLTLFLTLFPSVAFSDQEKAVCPRNQTYVSADMYGVEWPFTINQGCLECKSNAVIMHSNGKTYNINGKALGRYKKVYIDSWEIRKPYADGGKMVGCMDDLIQKGLNLCK